MSGISIDLDVFNEIDDEVFLAPELENLATEEKQPANAQLCRDELISTPLI